MLFSHIIFAQAMTVTKEEDSGEEAMKDTTEDAMEQEEEDSPIALLMTNGSIVQQAQRKPSAGLISF
jgi:hypothetical protein